MRREHRRRLCGWFRARHHRHRPQSGRARTSARCRLDRVDRWRFAGGAVRRCTRDRPDGGPFRTAADFRLQHAVRRRPVRPAILRGIHHGAVPVAARDRFPARHGLRGQQDVADGIRAAARARPHSWTFIGGLGGRLRLRLPGGLRAQFTRPAVVALDAAGERSALPAHRSTAHHPAGIPVVARQP